MQKHFIHSFSKFEPGEAQAMPLRKFLVKHIYKQNIFILDAKFMHISVTVGEAHSW